MGQTKEVGHKELALRLARLEALLDTLVRSALRGRLMPAERKRLLRCLDEQQAGVQKARPESQSPRCPACRLPLPEEDPVRCPSCLVLLEEARRSARALRRRKSVL